MQSEFVGVDGCTGGWFSVGLNGNGYELNVFPTFGELLTCYSKARLILVDIPIGLPNGADRRHCEVEARGHLGNPRNTSVFTAPTRQTVIQAEQAPRNYADALKIERQATGGRGISRQAFAIAPKIAEVDNTLPRRAPQVREVHPEILF